MSPDDGMLETPGSYPADAGDEVAANIERERYRDVGPTALPVGADVAGLLAPDEVVLARHPSFEAVFVGVPDMSTGGEADSALTGALVLTSQRLLCVGRVLWSINLGEIEEAVVSGRRLLLVLPRGVGLAVDVDRPQLLRVQIAAARAACGNSADGRAP